MSHSRSHSRSLRRRILLLVAVVFGLSVSSLAAPAGAADDVAAPSPSTHKNACTEQQLEGGYVDIGGRCQLTGWNWQVGGLCTAQRDAEIGRYGDGDCELDGCITDVCDGPPGGGGGGGGGNDDGNNDGTDEEEDDEEHEHLDHHIDWEPPAFDEEPNDGWPNPFIDPWSEGEYDNWCLQGKGGQLIVSPDGTHTCLLPDGTSHFCYFGSLAIHFCSLPPGDDTPHEHPGPGGPTTHGRHPAIEAPTVDGRTVERPTVDGRTFEAPTVDGRTVPWVALTAFDRSFATR